MRTSGAHSSASACLSPSRPAEVRETYVRPPLVAREATPEWVARWRFRIVALLLTAVLVWLGFLLFQKVSGASDQDPGVEAASVRVTALR